MSEVVRSCSTCVHKPDGGSLDDVPAKCWFCTSFKTLVHWEPKVEPKSEEAKVSLDEYINTLSEDDPKSTSVSDGSTASYYELPKDSTELQDLISGKNMNAQIGEIFRECYRYGQASHCNEIRGINKILFYAKAEKERLERLSD